MLTNILFKLHVHPVFFWNGYSVLRFSLNMHFYFFLSLFLSEAFIKILQSITKKKLQPSLTINDETIVMRVFKLHAVYSPAGWPLLCFLHTFHKYLIFPFFMTGELAALCLSQAKAWTTVTDWYIKLLAEIRSLECSHHRLIPEVTISSYWY